MPTYHFRYVDSEGLTHHGEADAEAQDTLVRELQVKGTVLEVTLLERATTQRESSPRKTLLQRNLSSEDLALYTRQMATMLTAGLPLMKVLNIMRKRCTNQRFSLILDETSRIVQGGTRFSEALTKHPEVFSPLYLNLCKVGESSGQMALMIERLAELLDKDVATQRRIQSALAYPMFIFMFTAALAWVMLAFLMPLFFPMFTASGLDLPGDYPLTYWLMRLSQMINHPVGMLVSLALLVGGATLYKKWSHSRAGRAVLDPLTLRIPVLQQLVRFGAVSRLARTLATLIASGMPMLQALQLVSNASGNLVISGAVERVSNQVSKGKRLSDAIEQESAVFPDMLIQMAQVGEESGALAQMLERAADYYDAQLNLAIQRLLGLLEPAMMVAVGGIVCGFVMAVLLPILGLAQVK